MGSRWSPAASATEGRNDTTLDAESLGRELRRGGYKSTVVQHGVRAGKALNATRGAEVWGVFGHIGPGFGVVGERPLSYLFAGYPGWRPYGGGRGLSELPDFALDGMRLAIFSGCKSAVRNPQYGSYLAQGKRLGVDSVVGFRKITFTPVRRNLEYSSLFWARFGAYARSGNSVGLAMKRARGDIHRRYGRSYGFDSYAIGGAARRPASVRLRPARAGKRQRPVSPPQPPPTPVAAAVSRESGGVRAGEAATSGPIQVSEPAARAVARRRLSGDVSWFSREDMVLTSQRSVSHLAGERLLALTFRSRIGGVAGPASAEVEVDRRTGRVVYTSVVRTRARAIHPRIGRADAIAAARKATQAPSPTTSVTAEVWDRPRWIVKFGDAEAAVDGRTGSVLAVADPGIPKPERPR